MVYVTDSVRGVGSVIGGLGVGVVLGVGRVASPPPTVKSALDVEMCGLSS